MRDVLEKSNQVLGTSFDSVESFEKHLSQFKPQLEAQISEASEAIQDIKRELSNLQVKNENLEKPIKELELVKDQCPICKSDITPQKREELIGDYNLEIDNNQSLAADLGVKLKALENEKKVLDFQQSKIQSINLGILKEYLKSADHDQEEINNIDSSIQELQKKVVVLENIERDIKGKKNQTWHPLRQIMRNISVLVVL
nr:hypothetical protein [Methanobacterium formicicum]